jgi:K+ transporter
MVHGSLRGLPVPDAIVGISCAILIALFCVQRFGTHRVSFTFAPVVLTWFAFNVVVAIYNIATFYPGARMFSSPCWALHVTYFHVLLFLVFISRFSHWPQCVGIL